VPNNVVVRRNRIRSVVSGNQLEGVGIRLENSESAKVYNNTITGVAAVAIRAGGGEQGATANLQVKNNLIVPNASALAISLGSQAPGFVSRSNLFAPGSLFRSPTTASMSFADWQATGRDPQSRQASPQLNAQLEPGPAAVDWGEDVGLPFCGAGPDVGAVETGC
jgi:hypothetical protein